MLNHRRQIAEFLKSGSWLRSETGRLLSGLGLAGAISPQIAEAERKGRRRADNQERKNDDAGDNRDDREQGTQKERSSDQRNDNASAEDRASGDDSGKSGKRSRDESRREEDHRSEQSASDNGKTRSESSRRDADSDSSSRDKSSANDDSSVDGGRVREFEQQANEPVEDTPAVTTVTPANPNIVIDDIPTTSIADLVVEANDDVIATVSASGGFAFARSGDVIAVTGPDGASIIQTGDVSTDPTEPSDDGGNNDLDFSS